MKLYTNKISTGNAKSFDDFVADFRKKNQIKTAFVKTAEQEEADSSGQLDVEPLHQEGESTTMPKAGPSAKKDDGEKSAVATKSPDEEGPDSGQPKAEGSEKFTNDPQVPSKEEKGGSADAKTKVAGHCSKCQESEDECTCECKDCTASKEAEMKTAGIKGNCSKCGKPNFLCKGKCSGDDSDSSDDDKKDDDKKDDEKEAKTDEDEKEEKEASKKIEFVKIANLDEKNKGFLKEYWRQLFGDDYVNALIADK